VIGILAIGGPQARALPGQRVLPAGFGVFDLAQSQEQRIKKREKKAEPITQLSVPYENRLRPRSLIVVWNVVVIK